MLEVKNLSVRYGDLSILKNVSFSVQEGQWLMIIGPNGAGKSTALNAVTQGVGYTGEILLEGRSMKQIKPAERARMVGVLAQNHFVGYSFTVEEVVRLGRYAYSPGFLSGRRREREDEAAIERAMDLTGMTPLRGKSVLTLSGGELQRVFLAQVFAQEPRLLLLDEPTNHLDLIYQKQVFGLITEWLKTPGRAVVSVVHDLSLAKAFGTHAVLLDEGSCVARGTAKEVLSAANLNKVYRMDVSAWMRRMLSQWEEQADDPVVAEGSAAADEFAVFGKEESAL